MIYLTDERDLKNSEGICVIYFYAQWMHCHAKMKIAFESINTNIMLYAIDIDNFSGLRKRFGIISIPAVIVTGDGGEELKRINGMPLTEVLKKTINDIYDTYNHSK